MLILVGWGSCPVNFTLPTTAAPDPEGGFPAPAAPLAANELIPANRIAKTAINENCFFDFMRVSSSNRPARLTTLPGPFVIVGRRYTSDGRLIKNLDAVIRRRLVLRDRPKLSAFLRKVVAFLIAVRVRPAIVREIGVGLGVSARSPVVFRLVQLER